jgi:hypothetical protein
MKSLVLEESFASMRETIQVESHGALSRAIVRDFPAIQPRLPRPWGLNKKWPASVSYLIINGNSRTNMAKRNDSVLELLSQCSWWVSVILSVSVYIVLRFIVPTIEFKNPFLKGLAGVATTLALPLGIVLVIPAPVAFYNSLRKKKLLDKQRDLDSIKALPWKEFEELIAEAYRRKGYSVVENDGLGPDDGIDLVLKKSGNLFLVQCKHWKTQKVDVRVVREMYGLMTASAPRVSS